MSVRFLVLIIVLINITFIFEFLHMHLICAFSKNHVIERK